MITFAHVFDAIKAALTQRPAGTQVQVAAHENFELLLLNYVEQFVSRPMTREAHAVAAKGVNCALAWDTAFEDTGYSCVVNGFDGRGNPVEVYFISRSNVGIVVKTLENANITALAFAHTA